MATKDPVIRILERSGAILRGHFVLTSGRHADTYVNKDMLYVRPRDVSRLCRLIADQFAGLGIEVVVAPAVGGVALSQWVTWHLTVRRGLLPLESPAAVYAEKSEDGAPRTLLLRRGYGAIVRGRRVLVVDDILTTGGSLEQTVQAVNDCGGLVQACAVIVNRGGISAQQLGVQQLVALTNMQLETWPAAECPLCASQVAVNTDVGHGAQFLAQRLSASPA